MDRIETYREIIKGVIRSVADFLPVEEGVRIETIFDDADGHYELLSIGWSNQRRIHSTLVHIDLQDGKVWVERDGTDLEIVQDLLDAGIPSEHMVLGFHPPNQRKFTDFAVA
ncbi:MAG: hypothetical protein JWL77_123 [Chthonomonadaceae bacterium]|nr:hypothetical protein [Chthonomonadaceae bacterium]